MQSTTLLTIVGSIYLEDPSNTTSLTTLSNLSDLLLNLQQSASDISVSRFFFFFFIFQHFEQPIPQCYMTLVLRKCF